MVFNNAVMCYVDSYFSGQDFRVRRTTPKYITTTPTFKQTWATFLSPWNTIVQPCSKFIAVDDYYSFAADFVRKMSSLSATV